MEQKYAAKALFIVINAGYADDVIEIARSQGACGATIIHARGEGSHHEVIMGITVDEEKEIVVCLVDSDTAEKVMAAIKEKAGIKTPAHAICFSLPVDKLVGISCSPAVKTPE